MHGYKNKLISQNIINTSYDTLGILQVDHRSKWRDRETARGKERERERASHKSMKRKENFFITLV